MKTFDTNMVELHSIVNANNRCLERKKETSVYSVCLKEKGYSMCLYRRQIRTVHEMKPCLYKCCREKLHVHLYMQCISFDVHVYSLHYCIPVAFHSLEMIPLSLCNKKAHSCTHRRFQLTPVKR